MQGNEIQYLTNCLAQTKFIAVFVTYSAFDGHECSIDLYSDLYSAGGRHEWSLAGMSCVPCTAEGEGASIPLEEFDRWTDTLQHVLESRDARRYHVKFKYS